MKSIFVKNFSLVALMVVMSFSVLGASFIILGRSVAINERKDSIAINARAVAQTTSAYLSFNELNSWDFRVILSTVSESTNNLIFITDADGVILNYAEFPGILTQTNKIINADLMATIRNHTINGDTYSIDNFDSSTPYYFVAAPVILEAGYPPNAYVFVGSDFSSIIGVWTSSSRLFVMLAFIVVFLSLSMSYYTSKRQTEPINEIAAAARRFARGDFSARVTNYGGEDEIAALTESFNSMAESLEKSEQLRSEFVANVSHELKTPMTTISGFADGLLDGTIPEEDQIKYLGIISSETKRLSRMVRQMLQMSRIQTVDPNILLSRSFDLTEVIIRTLVSFESKITENSLDVDALLPEERIFVRGDADSITQVFYNLLDNAIKFAAKNSSIGISLWKQDGKAYVSVENHGESISSDELPFIFDRFHKLDKSRSLNRDGVGLGLSIVKTILNNHNEDISVTSRDGITRFVFTVRLKGN